MRAPGQRERDRLAGGDGQRGADGVAQRRRVPAPQAEEGPPRPCRGAHEHLPVGAHDRQVGLRLAARQRHQAPHFVVDVADAADKRRGPAGRRRGAIAGAPCACAMRPASSWMRARARARQWRRAARPSSSASASCSISSARLSSSPAAPPARRLLAGEALERVEVELAGQQVVAHVQHLQQHAGQLLAARACAATRAGCCARPATGRPARPAAAASGRPARFAPLPLSAACRRELQRLGAHQPRHGEQRVRQHQHAIARIEQRRCTSARVDQVGGRAEREIQRRRERLVSPPALAARPSRKSWRT